jgi:hypothetical protein
MSVNLRNVTEKQELAILEKEIPEVKTLLQIYPPEMYSTLLNNKDKLDKIAKAMNGMSRDVCISTIIMKCSNTCIYKDVCILFKNELAPLGFPCPVEKKVIMDLEYDIVKSLDIDRNDPIEMEMLWDLIDTKILDMRSSGALSDGRLTQIVEQKVGQAIVSREEMSPNVEIKLELKKLKHSIIDSFAATRRAKKKYGMQSDVRTLEAMIKEAAANAEEE